MQKDLISEISSPLVSFIITTSNHQKEYLVECINSILQLSLNAKERETRKLSPPEMVLAAREV